MKKRAEMTTQQIVILIVLIASFAVILFFFFKLNLGSNSQKEICHNSVVMRANMPLGGDSIPLNCKREYICITGDGSCEKMTNPVIHKVKTKEEVYQVLADELADCWWMFGEGKIDYVGKDTFPGLYCSLCSQIAFDDSVKKIFDSGEFDKRKFYEYMASQERVSEETYSEYLYGTRDLEKISGGIDFGNISLDEQYFAMMGIVSETSVGSWEAIGGILIGTAGVVLAVPTGGGSLVFATVAIGSTTAGVIGGKLAAENFISKGVEGDSGNKFISPALIEANSKEYNSFNCKSITTLS